MSYFLNFEGGSQIPGAVTSKSHEKWIEFKAIDFSSNRSIKTQVGNAANRHNSRPALSEITITKDACNASSLLFRASVVGETCPTVKIDLCNTDTQLSAYLQLELSDVVISSYRLVGNDQNRPQEEIKLNYGKIEFKYIPRGEKNQQLSPVATGYDLVEAKEV